MKQNIQVLFITLLISFILIEVGLRINGKHNVYGSAAGLAYYSPFEADDMGWTHTVNPFYQYMILVVGSSLQRPPGCILPAGTKKGKFDGVSIPLRGTRRSHRRPGTPRSVRKKRGRLWRVPPRSNSGPRGRQKSWFRCLVALRTLQTPPKASLLP